jgi:translation initiation factor 2B subunit (eIF-2B alpha/beta/delta family)
MFAELLFARKIPLHICSNSWKFDPSATMKHKEIIEQRSPKEVWQDAPKHVFVEDPAFEPIIMPHVYSIISELGVLTPATFLKQVKLSYLWMRK